MLGKNSLIASLFTSFDARALALSAFSLELFKQAELREFSNVSAFNSLKINYEISF